MAVGFLLLGGTGLFAYAAIPAGEHGGWSLAIASAMMAGVALLIITIALPRFHRYFIGPPQELAAIAGMNLGAQDTLIAYGGSQPSLIFYAKRRCAAATRCIEMISPGEEEKLRPLLDRSGQVMILTQERLRAKLPPPAATYPVALSRYGYVLLAKNPTF